MNPPAHHHSRYYTTYSGIKLPLKLVNPLETDEIRNRNTYFCAYYNEDGQLLGCEKRVYGEVEFSHQYEYHPSGTLKSALFQMQGDAAQRLEFTDHAV